jgi:hypothetical protein
MKNLLNLHQFTGTENYYRHLLGIVYTDGVQYLAQEAGAYWLIDAIASWQIDPVILKDWMLQEIQFWKLQVNSDNSAVLSCERDTDDVVLTQDIPFTDFPLESIKLYLNHKVLMLPSEY